MPRPRLNAEPMTGAQRVQRYRQNQAAEIVRLRAALQHAADGIAHARELGAHWTEDQRQAWLNGLEATARRALP